ncbi:hypothetical protein GCM10023235_08760 [Kitasatospora terrestris]|uniref:Lipoprotein n=1 Tax=Kitasatospora terrestris TaxID=258051 RepID=A0ABP9DGM3_9ACTN
MGRGRSVRCAGGFALVLVVAGCTTPHHDRALPAPSASVTASAAASVAGSPAATDCADPRYEFTPAVETETLTHVTAAVTVTAAGGGPLNLPGALAVRPITAAATSSVGDSDARRVYDAFVHQSPTPGLPEFGGVLGPYPGSSAVSTSRPGRFVGYAFNWVITSSFVRHCNGADAVGTVTTFRPRSPVAGLVDCADPRGEVQQQAARLMCGTGS